MLNSRNVQLEETREIEALTMSNTGSGARFAVATSAFPATNIRHHAFASSTPAAAGAGFTSRLLNIRHRRRLFANSTIEMKAILLMFLLLSKQLIQLASERSHAVL